MEMHGKTQEASVQIENVSRRISAAVLRGELEGDWRAVKRVVDDIQSLGEMGRPGEDVVLQPLVLLLWATVMAADSMNDEGVSVPSEFQEWPVTIRGQHVTGVSLHQALLISALDINLRVESEEPQLETVTVASVLGNLAAKGDITNDGDQTRVGDSDEVDLLLMKGSSESITAAPPQALQMAALEMLGVLAAAHDERILRLLASLVSLSATDNGKGTAPDGGLAGRLADQHDALAGAAAGVLTGFMSKIGGAHVVRSKVLEWLLPLVKQGGAAHRARTVALVKTVAPFTSQRVFEYASSLLHSSFDAASRGGGAERAAGVAAVRETAIDLMLAVSHEGHVKLLRQVMDLARDSKWPLRRFALACLPMVVARGGTSGDGVAAVGPGGRALSTPYSRPEDQVLDGQVIGLVRERLGDAAAQVREMALRVLVKLGVEAGRWPGLRQAVTACVHDSNWVVREAATECIAHVLSGRGSPLASAETCQSTLGTNLGSAAQVFHGSDDVGAVHTEAVKAVSAALFEDVSAFSHHVRRAAEPSIVIMTRPERRKQAREAVEKSRILVHSVYVPSPPVDSVGRPRWRGTGEGLGGPGEDDGKPPPATNSGPTSADKVGESLGTVSRRPNTSRSIAEIHSRLAAREERARRGAPGPEDMVEIVCGGTVSRGSTLDTHVVGAPLLLADKNIPGGAEASTEVARRRLKEKQAIQDWICGLGKSSEGGAQGFADDGRSVEQAVDFQGIETNERGLNGHWNESVARELPVNVVRFEDEVRGTGVVDDNMIGKGVAEDPEMQIFSRERLLSLDASRAVSTNGKRGETSGADSTGARHRRQLEEQWQVQEMQALKSIECLREVRDTVQSQLDSLVPAPLAKGSERMKAFPKSRPQTAASATQPWQLVGRLEVTVLGACNVPSSLARRVVTWSQGQREVIYGGAHSVCRLGFLGQEHQTAVVADSPAPQWGAQFQFPFFKDTFQRQDAAVSGHDSWRDTDKAGHPERTLVPELEIALLDQDERDLSLELLGSAKVDYKILQRIMRVQQEMDYRYSGDAKGEGSGLFIGEGAAAAARQYAKEEGAQVAIVNSDGVALVGQDGHSPCTVSVRIRFLQAWGATEEEADEDQNQPEAPESEGSSNQDDTGTAVNSGRRVVDIVEEQRRRREYERCCKELAILQQQVRDLEVAYDRRFLRDGHASPADAHRHEPDAIVGLHIAAGVGLRVVVRKQLAARLFPRLLDDSQGGAGAIVWVDDGAVAALSATGHESLGGDMAGQLGEDTHDKEMAVQQSRGVKKEGLVCEVLWDLTGVHSSYSTGLLGEYHLALYDPDGQQGEPAWIDADGERGVGASMCRGARPGYVRPLTSSASIARMGSVRRGAGDRVRMQTATSQKVGGDGALEEREVADTPVLLFDQGVPLK